MDLREKKAIVTGGAKGIGREIALKLAKLGADVIVNYNSNGQKAEEVVMLIKAMGRESYAIKADVSSMEQAAELIKACQEKLGRVDILVNNAGITNDDLILKMGEEQWDAVIDTNLKSVFNCTKSVSKIMLKQKAGRIINIASIVGLIGNPGQGNYAAAKAGIMGFSKSIAGELGSRGITVNVIAPGFIQTDMTQELSEEVKAAMIAKIPLRALGKPEDIANLVGFLASEEASYITGQVINVDGGMVMV